MNVSLPQRSEKYLAMKSAAREYFELLRNASASEEQKNLARNKLRELTIKYGSDNPAYAAYLESKAESAGVV